MGAVDTEWIDAIVASTLRLVATDDFVQSEFQLFSDAAQADETVSDGADQRREDQGDLLQNPRTAQFDPPHLFCLGIGVETRHAARWKQDGRWVR